LVEQRTENPRVAGSTPALATIFFLKKYADLLGFLSYFACFVVSLTVTAFPLDDPLSRHFLLQFYYSQGQQFVKPFVLARDPGRQTRPAASRPRNGANSSKKSGKPIRSSAQNAKRRCGLML
jgi:hypothetical protein